VGSRVGSWSMAWSMEESLQVVAALTRSGRRLIDCKSTTSSDFQARRPCTVTLVVAGRRAHRGVDVRPGITSPSRRAYVRVTHKQVSCSNTQLGSPRTAVVLHKENSST
jgi:hypothetical protein